MSRVWLITASVSMTIRSSGANTSLPAWVSATRRLLRFEEHYSERVLQLADLDRESGLGNVQLAGCAREIVKPRHGKKGAQVSHLANHRILRSMCVLHFVVRSNQRRGL
jgi:hypothetical protein